MVHLLSSVWQQFGNVNTRDAGRNRQKRPAILGAGLRIPALKLTDASNLEDDQQSLVRFDRRCGMSCPDSAAEAGCDRQTCQHRTP